MMRVSIIIPCRNGERFLAACLESCLAQDLEPHQIIVVDDGSTDGSCGVVHALQARARSPIVLVQQSPGGGNRARNRGLELATGDAIQWLDADDLLAPGKLARQARFLRENPGADIVYSDFRLRHTPPEGADRVGPIVRRARSADMLRDLVADEWRPPLAFLVRASAARRLSWRPACEVGQDREYWVEAAIRGLRFAYLPGVAGDYRRHGASVSTTRARRRIERHLEHLGEIEAELDRRNMYTPARREALAYRRLLLARELTTTAPDRAARELARVPWRALGSYRARFSPGFRATARAFGTRNAVSLGRAITRSYSAA